MEAAKHHGNVTVLANNPPLDYRCHFLLLRAHRWSVSLIASCSTYSSSNPSGYAVGSLALVADSFHMLKYVSIILVLTFFSFAL